MEYTERVKLVNSYKTLVVRYDCDIKILSRALPRANILTDSEMRRFRDHR